MFFSDPSESAVALLVQGYSNARARSTWLLQQGGGTHMLNRQGLFKDLRGEKRGRVPGSNGPRGVGGQPDKVEANNVARLD